MNIFAPDSVMILDGFLTKYHPNENGIAVIALNSKGATWENAEQREECFPGIAEDELIGAYFVVRFFAQIGDAATFRTKLLGLGLQPVVILIRENDNWKTP